jgi:hypothetical protein
MVRLILPNQAADRRIATAVQFAERQTMDLRGPRRRGIRRGRVNLFRFSSWAMIDAANPSVNDHASLVFTVEDGGASGAPDILTEQRILLRLVNENGITNAGSPMLVLPWQLQGTMDAGNLSQTTLIASLKLQAKWITEDFDPLTVTWSDRPGVDTGASIDLADWKVTAALPATANILPDGTGCTRSVSAISTGRAYGVELRVSDIRFETSYLSTDVLTDAEIDVLVLKVAGGNVPDGGVILQWN